MDFLVLDALSASARVYSALSWASAAGRDQMVNSTMTRGKHGAAVAVRREACEQQAEIQTYQRKITELLADLEKTRTALADSERRRKTEVAKAKAQLQEGISPALTVAQRENRTLREERDHAQNEHKEIKRKW